MFESRVWTQCKCKSSIHFFCQIDDRNSMKIPLCLSDKNLWKKQIIFSLKKRRQPWHPWRTSIVVVGWVPLRHPVARPWPWLWRHLHGHPRPLVSCTVGMARCLHDTQPMTVDNLRSHGGDASMATSVAVEVVIHRSHGSRLLILWEAYWYFYANFVIYLMENWMQVSHLH